MKKGVKFTIEHKDFHKRYGFRNNTQQQLQDFLNNVKIIL